MAKLARVVASYGRSIEMSAGDWFRSAMELSYDLEEGDDPEEVKAKARLECKEAVLSEYLELRAKKDEATAAHRKKLLTATPTKAAESD